MRCAIPNYARETKPLQDLLVMASRKVNSLKKGLLGRVPLSSIGWDDSHLKCFETVKMAISNLVKLTHPKDDFIVCMFPDASQDFWSLILTQIPEEDVDKEIADQRHEPLAFLSGVFKGNQLSWAIIEKEAFPIIEGGYRLRHFLMRSKPFRIFTDHRNLAYIFDPYSRCDSVKRHTADRLARWDAQIKAMDYVIEHVDGDLNVWADIGTR